MYARVGELITKKFAGQIFYETIIEDVMASLHDYEKDEHTEGIVKNIVYNRQLAARNFRD